MSKLRAAIIDLDGTVYREDQLIPGAAAGIGSLRRSGIKTLFLTNSALDSPTIIGRKLSEFGIPTDPERVLTSGVITAKYLAEKHPDSTPLVIGEETIHAIFEQNGIKPTEDPTVADVLVTSLDREINYHKLTKALRALDEETLFVSTNPDRTRPGREGLLPSTGAISGAVEGMCQREPDIVLGKPSERATVVGLTQLGVSADEACMIGDRLNTDIAMGNAAGMTTVLVTTGVTDADAVEGSSIQPDHVIDSLAQLSDVLDW